MKRNLILSLLTGLLFTFALPPFRTGFLAYGALIPFFFLLESISIRDAFRWGYITGLAIDICTLFWIAWVTKAGFAGVILIMPLYFSIYAIIHVTLRKYLKQWAWLLLPFVWVFVEYIQSISEIAFPWTFLGYTQSYYLPWIQIAEYTSVFGVSFWIVILNILLYFILVNRRDRNMVLRLCIVFVLVFLLPAVYGIKALSTPLDTNKHLKVGLVQGNIDPYAKWDSELYETNYLAYEQPSLQFAPDSLDLIIWPETATPFYLRYERRYLQRVRNIVDSLDVGLITGSVDFEYDSTGDYLYYNSSFAFTPVHLQIQKYSKMLLVPFSERVPYRHYFPFNLLKKLLVDYALGIGSYSKGDKIKLFSLTKGDFNTGSGYRYKVGVAICYESVFPDHIRKMTGQGADLLTIITNDAWFGRTTAPYQHTQYAVFRAIENRISIARCANTGISCFISPYGKVSQQTPIFQKASIHGNVALCQKETFFKKHGNIFAKFATFVTLITLFSTLVAYIGKRMILKRE